MSHKNKIFLRSQFVIHDREVFQGLFWLAFGFLPASKLQANPKLLAACSWVAEKTGYKKIQCMAHMGSKGKLGADFFITPSIIYQLQKQQL